MSDLTTFENKLEETQKWLREELSGIRTGRASSSILEDIRVDSYGTPTPLNQVASMTTEDARTLRISPWDTSLTGDIEKAIVDEGLGVSVSTDEKGLRVHFPDLTSERREDLIKIAGKKHEEARVALRHARDDMKGDIEKRERAGDISEDESARLQKQMQDKMDAANKELEEIYSKKEKEIRG